MKTKRMGPLSGFLPFIVCLGLVFPLTGTPPAVLAQDGEPTPTPVLAMAPSEEPTVVPSEPTTEPQEPTAVPLEPTAEPQEPTSTPLEPVVVPTGVPVLPTETLENPTEIPSPEPSFTPAATETTIPTATASPSITPTVTQTSTALPLVVPLIQPQGVEIIPDRYIVVYKNETGPQSSVMMAGQIDAISAMGASVDFRFSSTISGFSGSLSSEALTKLRQDPSIAFIEMDQVVWLTDDITGNSIQSSPAWGLDRIDQRDLPLDGAYTYYQSGAGVNVYVFDSGIDTSHPDFGGRASNDFDTVDGGLMDCNGHGTHVAGLIGGSTSGAAKAASLHGVRVVNCGGKGSISSVIAAVDWLTANHIKPAVANLSYTSGPSDAEDLAISRSMAAGITYVAAAGNDGGNACQYSPSRVPGVITVGAIDSADSVTGFSNRGACVDIFAPGSEILSTTLGGSNEIRSGASQAAPFVAGAAALVLQSNPSFSPANVTERLVSNSTKGLISGNLAGAPNRLLYTSPLQPAAPAAPVTVSPANGVITNTSRPYFSWKMTSTADSYNFQVASDNSFASIIKETTGSSLYYTPDFDLPDGIYYWRVRAINSNASSIPGDWSGAAVLTVDRQGPDAPVLSSPLDNATPVGIPTFIWLKPAGAIAYQFEMDDSADFNSPVLSTPDGSISGLPALTVLSYLPTGLMPEIPYYWRVRARDGLGNWGAWSSPRVITIQLALPPAPAIIYPVAGSAYKIKPSLAWNSSVGGVTYQVQISGNNQFTGTLVEDATKPAGTFSHSISSTLADGTWYWRVRAFNTTHGAGAWSVVSTFVMDTTGPAAPVLTSPATDFTPVSIPVFSWQAPSSARTYQFEIGTSLDNGTTLTSIHTTPDGSIPGQPALVVTSYKPPSLPLETALYWHVRAFDVLGNAGSWSEARSIILQSSIPAAPILVSPLTGAAVNTLPSLAWNTVNTAITYDVQLSTSSAFTGTVLSINSVSGLSASPSGSLADGIWYWRVRSRNQYGGLSVWSAVRSFVMDTKLPAAPFLVSPKTDVIRVTPSFTWTVVTGATGYQFEYGTATDFSMATFSPVYTSPVQATISILPPAVPVGTYFWHVRAVDAAGNLSDWSELRIINMNAPILAAPVPVSPISSAYVNTRTPVLKWNCVNGASSYFIELADTPNFTGANKRTPFQVPGTCTSILDDVMLTHTGTWYWRVAAINQTNEFGKFGAATVFIFDNEPPAAPVLTYPADYSSSLRSIPAFTWGVVTGANAYQFQLDTDVFTDPILITTPGDAIPGTPLAVSTFKPGDLKPMVNYSWRVRARDAAMNWGDWSQMRNFTLLPAIPAAPALSLPAAGYLTNNPQPQFSWNTVFSGDTYRVQVDKVGNFLNPVINQVLGSGVLTYTPPSSLGDGLYYWRVQAINQNSEPGVWSTSRAFLLDTTAPQPPVLVTPARNAMNLRSTPVFSWSPAVGATAYQFQLDDDSGFDNPLISTPENAGSVPVLTTVSYKTPVLNTLQPYYWRVRSRDAAGNWGLWAEAATFEILPVIPAAPVLTAPASSYLTRTIPVLSWASTASAVDYELAIDDDSRFLTPWFSSRLGNVTTYTPADLPPDGTYYWRVRAVNANNEAGPWSLLRTFIVDTLATVPPTLVSPANNAAGIRAIPVFTWSVPAGSKYFQFQIDDNAFADPEHPFYSTPGGVFIGSPLTAASFKPAGLVVLKPYQWRVRTCDPAGNWSVWSDARTVTLQPLIPAAPVLVSPSAGSITADATPQFAVKETPSTLRYEFELTPVTPAGGKIFFDSIANQVEYSSTTLKDGTYSWRARLVNAANEPGAWSAPVAFTLDTQPPAAPLLTAPANTSSDGRVIPLFTWSVVPASRYYQIQIDDSSDFTDPDISSPGLAVTSYKPAALPVLTTYYWRVCAMDAAGNIGNWSEIRSLRLLPLVPPAPLLVSPTLNFLTNDPTPEFRWKTASSAAKYDIQLARTATFASPILTDRTADASLAYTPAADLSPAGIYYWRVRAVNQNDEPGAWSTGWYFSLDTLPPEAPILLTPPENTLLAPGTPLFSWKPVTGAVYYQFEYDDNSDLGSPLYTSPDGRISGLAAITAASFKPPAMAPAVPYYWHVRARDAAGNWGDWSLTRPVTIQAPLPGVPTLAYPLDKSFSANRQPVFSWSSSSYGYVYEVQLSSTSTFVTNIKDEVTVVPNQLHISFAGDLPAGDIYWRVRALNVNGQYGAWSAVRQVTLPASYDFSSDSSGWTFRPGSEWTVSDGNLVTDGTGVINSTSSAVIDGVFSEFTVEARVKMGLDAAIPVGQVGNDHGLILFGSDTLNSANDPTNAITFHIGQKMTGAADGTGQFSIDMTVNGVKRSLTGNAYVSGPVNFNGWNVLKVVSKGTTLTFYINNIKVYTVTNTTFKAGRLGVYATQHVNPAGTFVVDWVRVSPPG